MLEGGQRHIVPLSGEFGFSLLPQLPTARDFPRRTGSVSEGDEEPHRPLREGLDEGTRQAEPEVGGRIANTVLEYFAHPRLMLNKGHDRRHFRRDGSRIQEPLERAHTDPKHI